MNDEQKGQPACQDALSTWPYLQKSMDDFGA